VDEEGISHKFDVSFRRGDTRGSRFPNKGEKEGGTGLNKGLRGIEEKRCCADTRKGIGAGE